MKNIYTVSQINYYLKDIFIKDTILNRLYIKGEVSNCKYHTSGHIYFTLKDNNGQIACVMFASMRNGLKFRMQDGQSIIALGNMNIYEQNGKYQLYVKEILLEGSGMLHERYEQLKQKLEKEGLFDCIYKKKIPKYVNKIGIVTASTGAAIQDIVQIVERRNPYVQLILFPALVQGEGAAKSIVTGLQTLDALNVDLLIVGRGGGSIEDLWAFNEEIVVRAVFYCKTPVISAVGHETDTTLTDFVSDLRAPTPSAAAELAVDRVTDRLGQLEQYERRLNRILEEKIALFKQRIKEYTIRFNYNNPLYQTQQKRQQLLSIEEQLHYRIEQKLTVQRHRLELYRGKINSVSPLNQLKKGYAYIELKETALYSITQVKVEDQLTITLADGELVVRVEGKKERREEKWQESKNH